jgi:hypothetical protein
MTVISAPAKSTDGAAAEALSSVGLLLNIAAVMAFAGALAAFGVGNGGIAAAAAVLAVAGFIASLVCFALDSRRSELDR